MTVKELLDKLQKFKHPRASVFFNTNGHRHNDYIEARTLSLRADEENPEDLYILIDG